MGAPRDVRSPAAAGSFYPGIAAHLSADVDALLREARRSARPPGESVVRGVVTPHAGYVYSGPIAATAYAFLSTVARPPSRIVIIGPSHFEPLRGLGVAGHRSWSTPLGEVAIDAAGREVLLAAGAAIDDGAHRSEHSIEVQVPFLQRCFPDVPLLPVTVGDGSPEAGAEMLAEVLTEDALLVVSTDLSHYHDAETARRLDARTAAAVEALDIGALHANDACGVDALRVGMAWARRRGHRLRLLDLRNSADTAGDPYRVVGYGAFAITAGQAPPTPHP